jgi:hypothetical protein
MDRVIALAVQIDRQPEFIEWATGFFCSCAYDAPSDAPIAINLIAENSLFSRHACLFAFRLVGFGVTS